MEIKKGKTGLTQKEAIFEIFKSILGDKFYPGMDVRKILCTKPNSYGRSKWVSPQLQEIILRVYNGISNGTIPSKLNTNEHKHYDHYFQQLQREYANRIVHYWMKHDKRLNGSVSGSRMASARKRQIALEVRLNSDPMMQSLKALFLQQEPNSALQYEVETYLMGRLFRNLLETYGIEIESLTPYVRDTLKLDATKDSVGQDKKAAA